MFILAFNLNWFTTIPGILISLGVVLLIIAFILFIVGGKKAKVENKEDETVVNEPVAEAVDVQPITSTEVGSTPVDVNSSVNIVSEEPKFEEINFGTPGVDPISTTPVQQPEAPVTIEEPVENKIDVTPVQPNEFVFDTTAPSNEVHSAPYGGTNPADTIVVPTERVEEVKPTIYGGNDPLEATQNLPKVDEHHELYGGAINEVKIVEPMSEPVIEVPEVKPIETEVPVQEPISIEIPAQPVEIPSVSEPTMDIPAAPVEIPTTPVEETKPSVEEL